MSHGIGSLRRLALAWPLLLLGMVLFLVAMAVASIGLRLWWQAGLFWGLGSLVSAVLWMLGRELLGLDPRR